MKLSAPLLLAVLAFPVAPALCAPLPTNADYDVGFSPGQGSLELILKEVRSARASILVAAYSFTSKPIASALLDASRRGVKVAVVADEKSNSRSYSAVSYLANSGIPVRLNGHYAIFHHKFMVIDGATLETGSFNYTAAAAKSNAENVLLLRNVKPLAAHYTQEWRRLWDEATPLGKSY
ncbi:phospholipase D family protein [Paludibacterium yongneupense]|uniref:phospholipase D family nuclease n=1 Tax=Paludibacterium yongneupense TaxID=400061 RepID=UPI000426AB20|nr:phospholipase D family protein [Paludibacterium yongneupense]